MSANIWTFVPERRKAREMLEARLVNREKPPQSPELNNSLDYSFKKYLKRKINFSVIRNLKTKQKYFFRFKLHKVGWQAKKFIYRIYSKTLSIVKLEKLSVIDDA